LIGLSVGLGFFLPPGGARHLLAWARRHTPLLLFTLFMANVPDLDYLPGLLRGDWNSWHHGYTHTLGWVLLVATGTWLIVRGLLPSTGPRIFFFLLTLLGTHVLADYFTGDRRPPYGVIAFWPCSDTFVISPLAVFPHLRKDDLQDAMQWSNLLVIATEAIVTGIVLLLVLAFKSRPPRAT